MSPDNPLPPNDLFKAMNDSRQRSETAARAIVDFARTVVFTLKDSGAPSVADELARRIHIYDCEIEEAGKLLKNNLEGFFDLISRSKGPQE